MKANRSRKISRPTYKGEQEARSVTSGGWFVDPSKQHIRPFRKKQNIRVKVLYRFFGKISFFTGMSRKTRKACGRKQVGGACAVVPTTPTFSTPLYKESPGKPNLLSSDNFSTIEMEPFYNLLCVFGITSVVDDMINSCKLDIVSRLPPEIATKILR